MVHVDNELYPPPQQTDNHLHSNTKQKENQP